MLEAGYRLGADSTLGKVALNDQGRGSIIFPADDYPYGPITLRISQVNGTNNDNCYLQLYKQGGVLWNEGMPANRPAAAGLKLIFADDFESAVSFGESPKATYYDHKPPNGAQDFSTIPFTSFDKPNNPFSQVGTYLRIRASEKAHSAGVDLLAEE